MWLLTYASSVETLLSPCRIRGIPTISARSAISPPIKSLRLGRLDAGAAFDLAPGAGALDCCRGAGFGSPEGIVSLLMRYALSLVRTSLQK
jgi:hypothetical protein